MLLFFAIFFSCVFLFYIVNRIYYPRVLLYHSVSDDIPSKKINISVSKFEEHINYLIDSGYNFFFMREIFDTKNLLRKKAFITFDDGLRCLYDNVFPIIKEYNIKITVYICKDCEGRDLLSVDQIKEMSDSGLVEFGAHTLSHKNLMLCDLKTSKYEINESKKFVEELTNKRCSSFAYPYGKYDYKHVIQVSEAKFENAVIIGHKIYNYDVRDKFSIPRIEPRGTMNLFQFKILMLLGKYKI